MAQRARWRARRTRTDSSKTLRRVLQFDLLEPRQLLCNSLFACSLEHWEADDEIEYVCAEVKRLLTHVN